MKKRKRKRHHKKISHRIAGRSVALCAGFIIVVICIGISIFGILVTGERTGAKAGASESGAEASETSYETRADESTKTDGIAETEFETEGAVQYELEFTAASETSYQEESAEADTEAPAETAVTDNNVESPADFDVPDSVGGNAGSDNGILPGTILSADQLNLNELSQYFTAVPIEKGDAVYQRINGKSWQENDHISLSDLRYLKVLHYNFSGQIQVGEIIVNKSIAEDVIGIFEELFDCGYQIQSMYLIDNYWTGDPDDSDTASIDANNTSAFCYRPITNGTKLSNHAYGLAIDINPQQNPYVSYSSGSPKWYHENANDYIARDTGLPHVITHEDAAFLIFQKYGFTWGGDWNNPKDYQHFEKK